MDLDNKKRFIELKYLCLEKILLIQYETLACYQKTLHTTLHLQYLLYSIPYNIEVYLHGQKVYMACRSPDQTLEVS